MNEEKSIQSEEMLPSSGNATETIEENNRSQTDKKVEIVGVGFRTAGKTYYFSPKNLNLQIGTPVIVETARGIEMGKITIANRMVAESEIVPPLREIIRAATQADITRYEANRQLEEHAAEICREKIRAHKLEMDLVSVEYTFDNSKLLFYFTAENRVDFRELVKDLASVFKTRIELRQIGIRDEAKLMGGFGTCGRPFCCSTFLSDFVQVSIKMAKEQNFSLNSTKISGACGRLMCCLRYEHDTYEDAIKKTPSVGSYVSTPNGLGTVVECRPLAETIKVKLDEKADAPRLYKVADIRVLRSKGKSGLQPTDDGETVTDAPIEPVLESAPVSSPSSETGEKGSPNNQKKRFKKHRPRSKNKPQGAQQKSEE